MKKNNVGREKAMKHMVIYPGRFSPPTIGHMKAWQWLNAKYDNATIVTSNKVSPPRSPFNFQEKKALLMHAGVPANAVVQVRNPYRANEIVDSIDQENVVLIFAISKKDMVGNPRFAFKLKKDGSPSYLQSYSKNVNNLKPASQHGYITTVPTFEFDVLGKPIKSATEFRAQFAQADDSTQAEMVKDLYGSYSSEIYKLLKEKIV
jgi:nicotinamide mononucleotide adenylyltransferase